MAATKSNTLLGTAGFKLGKSITLSNQLLAQRTYRETDMPVFQVQDANKGKIVIE
jgi:hypothetical protein